MTVRVKLKATLVQRLGDDALADTVSARSFQRALSPDDEHDDTDLPGEGAIINDQYRLLNKLGAGMFGSVYMAERTDVPEHRVALKMINRAVYGGRDVERELVMLAAATHPNIVELKDHGMTADYVWLTMPLYDGETLAERLKRGTLTLREAHEIFLQVARGVDALHSQGLRHQDIKPENIYLAEFAGQLHPVLLDLGVAVEINSEFVAGTALYGSPEQVAALSGMGEKAPLSDRMDSYCLASTLLYALVGEDLFPGAKAKTPFDIVSAFEEREAKPLLDGALPELTGRPRQLLSEAFSRWLQRDPSTRPSAGELATELDVLLEKEREEERIARGRVQRQKTILRAVVAVLLTSLIAAGIYYYSKADYLRLAGELEEVRAQGKSSLDNLEGCNVALGLTEREKKACEATRARQEQELRGTIAGLESDRDGKQAQLVAATQQLTVCNDEAEEARLGWEADRLLLETERDEAAAAHEQAMREAEESRAAAEAATAKCEEDAKAVAAREQSCKSELASCLEKTRDPYDDVPAPPVPAKDTPAEP